MRATGCHKQLLVFINIRQQRHYVHAAREGCVKCWFARAFGFWCRAGDLACNQRIECSDHLKMKRWANPHCVGVDQFFAGPNSGSVSALLYKKWLFSAKGKISTLADFLNQLLSSKKIMPVRWLLLFWLPCRCPAVIQAIPPFRILPDSCGKNSQFCVICRHSCYFLIQL
ncbi:hypothetical protein NBRC3280_3371 [Acetobacter pasteurianus NBRC 3280]|uniref:Uncharacterized protein n=1 Tax=Acetobacter pasteurianus NBRC 3278 TaxID=1226660 RepID=A0A401X9J3_ACEPA|nr:hypothetical protein NBRC3277_3380 [Acetobacter pasteurianus NBRC 3277]GCD64408.1 hypothetical protein NBRC3278_3501 [Acetobacter pasteurianus NBRC 3278]GCD70736.1 hypothetical protein NBRC3280_3371 [Acetobacter pasteurianus NBRC 3280]